MALSVYFTLFTSSTGATKIPKNLPYDELQELYKNKIGLILATRNEEEHVADTLLTLLNQSFKYFTIIVTDRSDDKTLVVCDKFYNDHKSQFLEKDISLILLPWDTSRTTAGKVGQIQYAIEVLDPSLEIVGYVDADAEYSIDWLYCLAYGMSRGSDVVTSGIKLGKKEKVIDYMDNLDNQFSIISGQSALTVGIRGWMFGASVLYRRKAYEEINGFEGIEHIIMDDFALSNKFFKHGKKINYFRDRRTIVSVLPHPNPINQKIRWASANWADSDKKSDLITLSINLFPLLFYVALIGCTLLTIFTGTPLTLTDPTFSGFLMIGLLMFFVDLSVVVYLFIVSRTNLIYIPFYMLWISIIARPIVLYSFFQKKVVWKEEKMTAF